MLIVNFLPLVVFYQALFVCTNTQGTSTCGSFVCHHNSLCTTDGQSCQCGRGYTGPTCELDFDECDGHYPCYHRGHCQNTFGSYNCDCLQGWVNGVHQHCENPTSNDINFRKCMPGWKGEKCMDECFTDNDCKVSAKCDKHGRSHVCTCRPGWNKIGNECVDIDECQTTTPCNSYQVCTNTQGSYSCGCPPGYDGATCSQDIDECLTNHCNYSGICQNTIGSYKCNCLPGFEGENCQNVKASGGDGFAPSNISMFSLAVGSFVFSIISIIVVIVTRYKCKGNNDNQEDSDVECDQPRKSDDWKDHAAEKNFDGGGRPWVPHGGPFITYEKASLYKDEHRVLVFHSIVITNQRDEHQRNVVRMMSRTARISAMEFGSANNEYHNVDQTQHGRINVNAPVGRARVAMWE